MEDFFNYRRRKSSIVNIGNTPLGGDNPIRIQSMANVSTMDTDAAVCQAIRMIEAGAEYVRFTAQGEREARNLGVIRKQLSEAGYTTPLVADIHFNPRAADAAAEEVEKVRINPGNYVDKVKTFDLQEYTDEEYAAELQKIRDRFIPFLNICKAHGTAIRIGVNHGSLSDRIMSRYGDTPEGMVASCMEFLRICRDENFPDVVISIKASNTVVMVKTVRLLVRTMEAEDMYYPLHLGVTEAGDGEDGRIKSAVGIGALLSDGIGDTIRVSLSEDPEAEIPVARKLVDYILEREGHEPVETSPAPGYDPVTADRRHSRVTERIGGNFPPVVISDRSNGDFEFDHASQPDYIYIGKEDPENLPDADEAVEEDVESRLQQGCELLTRELLAERPRLGIAFQDVSIRGNRILLKVPNESLYDEVTNHLTDIRKRLCDLGDVRSAIEFQIEISENKAGLKPIKVEDRLRYLTEKNPLVTKLRRDLDLDIE